MRAVYSIISRNQVWCLRLNGQLVGPAESLLAAAKIAIRSAERLRALGWHAHIMVQTGNTYETLWVNGAFKRRLAA